MTNMLKIGLTNEHFSLVICNNCAMFLKRFLRPNSIETLNAVYT